MNTETLITRVEEELRLKVEKAAKEKGLSISSYLRMILKEKLD